MSVILGEASMVNPRYPEIEVRVHSVHPMAVIGATRFAMRRAGVAKPEIRSFSDQAFTSGDATRVCREWVSLVLQPPQHASA